MKTVYVCDRGKQGLSPIAWTDKADAEFFANEQSPGETWPVVTFVSLKDVCDWLGRADKGHWMVKDLREAVSDVADHIAADAEEKRNG